MYWIKILGHCRGNLKMGIDRCFRARWNFTFNPCLGCLGSVFFLLMYIRCIKIFMEFGGILPVHDSAILQAHWVGSFWTCMIPTEAVEEVHVQTMCSNVVQTSDVFTNSEFITGANYFLTSFLTPVSKWTQSHPASISTEETQHFKGL